MKLLLFISTFTLCSLALGQQAKAQASGGFAGIQVGSYRPAPKQKRTRQRDPNNRNFSFSWSKGKQIPVLAKWSVGADLTLQKNTFEFAPEHGKLIGVYRAAVPIYANYQLDKRSSLECGFYLGALCHSNDVFATEFVRLSQREHLTLSPDYGMMAGMSWRVGTLGSIKLRYTYGLTHTYPIQLGINEENKFLEIGLVTKL